MNVLALSRELLKFNTVNPPGSESACIQHIGRLLENAGFTIHTYDLATLLDVEGVWTDPSAPWVKAVFELVESITGIRPEVRGVSYFTDASALVPAYGHPPCLLLGPGEVQQAHQTNEYCRIDRIEQAVELYTETIRNWCKL